VEKTKDWLKIPLSSTNQKTAFIYKVELYDKYQLYCVDYFNICLYISGKHIKTHYYSDSQSGQALAYVLNIYLVKKQEILKKKLFDPIWD
jgi:hypothetical protein